MASIKRFGFAAPIIARRDGEVIAGHTRLKAAEALGLDRVPVRYMDLDPAEARLLALADNRLGEIAEWNKQDLTQIMSGFSFEDLEVAGWDEKDLELMGHQLIRDNEVADVEVEENDVEQRVSPGDVWKCGRHMLVCGDSEDVGTWAKLTIPEGPRMMITDPPYGVNYDASWREKQWHGARAVGKVTNDDRASWKDVYALSKADVAYVWCADKQILTLLEELSSLSYELRALIMWKKSKFAISRGHYHHGHEPCLYSVRKGATAEWCGDRSQSTVWDIGNPKIDNDHSTSKPIECMARPMRNHNFKVVVDPFGGSGTTMLAAEQLDRDCYMIELEPKYCDIVLARWEKLTGGKATQ